MSGANAPRVLVVEDHDGIRSSLIEVLEEEGYSAAGAADGAAALEYLRSHGAPSLILLDLMMPRMSGWELVVAKSQDPALAEIPVMLLSGAINLDEQAAYLRAEAFIRKPIDPDVMLRVVEIYCGPPPRARKPDPQPRADALAGSTGG